MLSNLSKESDGGPAMNKRLLIVGPAPSLKEDRKALERLDVEFLLDRMAAYDVMAIGLDMAEYIGRIDHVATYHSYELPDFRKRREAIGGNTDYETHSHEQFEDLVNRLWPYVPPSGSSAMLGIEAGMGMGYKRIVVAGCPLVDRKYTVTCDFRPGWIARYDVIKDAVRSMSGWTMELLGAPTKEWLDES